MSTSRFDKGHIEFQSVTGAYFSLSSGGSDEPTLNYTLSTYRFGIMMYDVTGDGWWRGNTELLVEGFFGTVFEGPGDYLGGANLALRYNFVPLDSNWTPYLQAGVGGFYNDIHRDRTQSRITKTVELNLQASVGVRYLFSEHWSIALEGGYQRVAAPASSHQGLDAMGMQVGFSRFF